MRTYSFEILKIKSKNKITDGPKTGTIICIFLISLILHAGCVGKDTIEVKRGIIKQLTNTKSRLVRFSNYLDENFDTSFYGQRRSKSDEYFFFYMKGDSIKGSFVPGDEQCKVVNKEYDFYGFREMWSFEDENFYRFKLENNGKQIALALVLKTNQQKFIFSRASKIPEHPTVTNTDSIRLMSDRPYLFALDNSILVYFNSEGAP